MPLRHVVCQLRLEWPIPDAVGPTEEHTREVRFAAVRFCLGELVRRRVVDLIWGHPLTDEVGVDKARLISVRSSVRLDDSNKRLEELNIISVAGVMALIVGANLVLCLFECPGALLPCTEVAAVSSDKSQ